jgi:light-regulated signal transduction histidine kinase (bacteriophytochrome)
MSHDDESRERIGELQTELARANQEVLALTRELEDRVEARTEELLRLNQALEQRVIDGTSELELLSKELQSFAYSVSHDLRAPLRHVDGFLDLLAEQLGPSLGGEAAHCFERIKSATRHMGLLISALQQLSSLSRQALVLRPLDLHGLVAGVVEGFKEAARDRQVSWTLDPLPTIHGDSSLIRILFQSLLDNAVKFTGRREQARIHVGCAPGAAGETVVFVRDNGAGFDAAYAHNLFGVFQRMHRQDEFEGIGVGLASVQRIIQRHGGRVWAESRPEEGATFFVAFRGPSP